MNESSSLIARYQEESIRTLSKGELILRLYDEVLKNLKYACRLFRDGNAQAAKKCTGKCRKILNYLIVILDRKYRLAEPLGRIYSYLIGQIIKANATGDTAGLERAVPQLEELRDAWAQSIKSIRIRGGKGRRNVGT
jgi:flagellar protein FliS